MEKRGCKTIVAFSAQGIPHGYNVDLGTNNPPELKGPHEYSASQGSVKLILDGQQRITTLYMLLRGVLPPYYTEQEVQTKVFGLHVNLLSMELEYYKKNRMEKDPLWVNITDLFQGKSNALTVIKDLDGEYAERHLEIVENVNAVLSIISREFLEQTVPIKAELREAIDIFYRVNSSGVNLIFGTDSGADGGKGFACHPWSMMAR